jgi:hypothetical protein
MTGANQNGKAYRLRQLGKWGVRITVGYLFLMIAVAPIATTLRGGLLFHSEQDDCVFGPISNQRYRELLAEARLSFWKPWYPFVEAFWSSTDRITDPPFATQLRTFVDRFESLPERVAASHAVMRSAGAFFIRESFSAFVLDEQDTELLIDVQANRRVTTFGISDHYVNPHLLNLHCTFAQCLGFGSVGFGISTSADRRWSLRTDLFRGLGAPIAGPTRDRSVRSEPPCPVFSRPT